IGTTGADGIATATLTNTVAGISAVTATLSSSASQSVDTTFVADETTAQVNTVTLTDTVVSKVANGTNTFTYTVLVKDANGNPVFGVEVTSVADKPDVTVAISSATDENGQAIITLTSTTKAIADITVSALVGSAASVNADKTVSFTAGDAAESTSSIVVDNATYVAGSDITVTVTLKDDNGNTAPGLAPVLTATTVTVPNSTEKADNSWADNGDGTYTGSYVANTTGTGLKANLKLSTWSSEVESSVYDISFSSPDLTKGTLTISKPRIVANNTDDAILTLNVVDSYGNGVSDLSNLDFIVEDNLGSIITSGISISNVDAGTNIGDYTAKISGDNIGDYKIRTQLNGGDFSIPYVTITLYSFSFEMTPSKATVVMSGTYAFIINAIPSDYPSDDTKYENVSAGISWASSDNSIASVTNSGLITGESVGLVDITASGSYKGFGFSNLEATLGVQGQIVSPIFGETQPTDKTGTLIIEPPDYSLIMYCGSIVDGIGSSEGNFFGGKTGGRIVINKLNLVSSVQISTGEFTGGTNTTERGIRQLTKLTFIMKDGSSGVCGKNSNTQNIVTETFVVPNNQVLEGVTVGGGNYLHTIGFITKLEE
ncbi:Ig-like domain-containing protein, partial [Yersinia pekkanenii]